MTGSFSSCGTPKEWGGLGVFGLGLWFSLSNFGRRWCFRKVCSVGLYLRKTFWSCSPHMPQAWTQQTPAPRKSRAFYLCDGFHRGNFPFESAKRVQMWRVGFLDASYLSVGSSSRPLVWATHHWQMAVTLVTDDVGRIQLSWGEKETIMPLNDFLCSAQSFY